MTILEEARRRLGAIPRATMTCDAPLAAHTRFGIGGPADIYLEAASEDAFAAALGTARDCGLPLTVIGGGTNLIVSDDGFRGAILRYTGDWICFDGASVHCASGATLQSLVDATVERGLGGLETMTGIPGSMGAAVYGNAGAYGHSLSERISSVRYFDGCAVGEIDAAGCDFRYRESVFKRRKEWVIFSVRLTMEGGDAGVLRATASDILAVRNRKYPPDLKCAGSIFKNLLLGELPPEAAARVPAAVVREGKVPSAWFLEQVGAKGVAKGGIRVADYHANLIYNAGGGTAAQLVEIISELKTRVRGQFGLDLEEEVQYVGF